MVLKNVKTSWAFLHAPDDNGNYRVTFEVTKEQKDELLKAMQAVAKNAGVSELDKCDWQGSFRIDKVSGKETFSAKCSKTFRNKKGEEVNRVFKVYDLRAKEMELVPQIANGAIMNISIEPYFVTYKQKKGVMLSLQSVQLVDYDVYSGGNPFIDEAGGQQNEEDSLFA